MVREVGASPPPPPPPTHLLVRSIFIYGQEPITFRLLLRPTCIIHRTACSQNEGLALKSQLFTPFRVDRQLRSQAPLRLVPLSLWGTNKRRRTLGTGLVDSFL